MGHVPFLFSKACGIHYPLEYLPAHVSGMTKREANELLRMDILTRLFAKNKHAKYDFHDDVAYAKLALSAKQIKPQD